MKLDFPTKTRVQNKWNLHSSFISLYPSMFRDEQMKALFIFSNFLHSFIQKLSYYKNSINTFDKMNCLSLPKHTVEMTKWTRWKSENSYKNACFWRAFTKLRVVSWKCLLSKMFLMSFIDTHEGTKRKSAFIRSSRNADE